MAGHSDAHEWDADDNLVVDGVTFVYEYKAAPAPGPSSAHRFFIRKDRRHTEAYAELLRAAHGANIVELGIANGGSAALLMLLADPRRLVAFELAPDPVAALAAFTEERGLTDRLRTYYGTDQGDRGRLDEILQAEFGDEPIDLVIDDASHLLEPTRASFETIFPRLRSGGLYCIEDWNWQHLVRREIQETRADPERRHHFDHALAQRLAEPDSPLMPLLRDKLAEAAADPDSEAHQELQRRLSEALADPESPAHGLIEQKLVEDATGSRDTPSRSATDQSPLLALLFELLLARAVSDQIVDEVTVGEHWIKVRRGPARLDTTRFRLGDAYTDDFGLLGWKSA